MYSPLIVQQRIEIAQQECGFELEYHSIGDVAEFNRRLERKYEDIYQRAESESMGSKDAAKVYQLKLMGALNNPDKPVLTLEERRWMENERMLVQCDAKYWMTRYYFIKTPTAIKRFSFLPAQSIYFDVVASLEERRQPIEMIIAKARQGGISTATEGFMVHAGCFTYGMNGIIASANKDMTAKMSQMTFLGYDSMPWWMKPVYTRRVESNQGMLTWGGMQSRLNFQHGNQMSAIARGDTILKYHLSEVASYADASELISEGLFKCVHADPNVFGILESTAEGDSGWWYDQYRLSKAQWGKRPTRLYPLFLPWFLMTDKYPTPTWASGNPTPWNWEPVLETRQMAAKAKLYVQSNSVLEKVLGSGYEVPQDQQYFWENNFLDHKARGEAKGWYQEMPTDDRECFQGSFDNVFGRELIADVYTTRKTAYWVYGLVGQSIEDRHELTDEEISWDEPRVPVDWKDNKGNVYRWELVPAKWIEPWGGDLDQVMESGDHNGKFFVWEKPKREYDYSVAVDTSNGIGRDSTVIAVLRRAKDNSEPDTQVAEFRSNIVNHVEAYAFALCICAFYAKYMASTTNYRMPYCSIEQIAAVGDTCQMQMRKMGYSRFHKFVRLDGARIRKQDANREGWYTGPWSRPVLTDGFVVAVQNGWVIIHSPWTIWEMDHWETHLTTSGKEKKEHSSSATDDGIFACAMAAYCPNDLSLLAERTKKRPGSTLENRVEIILDDYSGGIDLIPSLSYPTPKISWL